MILSLSSTSLRISPRSTQITLLLKAVFNNFLSLKAAATKLDFPLKTIPCKTKVWPSRKLLKLCFNSCS